MGYGKNRRQQGFTLIAALIIMVLLSGVAVGLLFMVTNENRMSGNDLEANLAYYGAESGMEKLTSDLSALYTLYMVPTNAQIQNLVNYPPTPAMVPGINYLPGNIKIIYPTDPVTGGPQSSFRRDKFRAKRRPGRPNHSDDATGHRHPSLGRVGEYHSWQWRLRWFPSFSLACFAATTAAISPDPTSNLPDASIPIRACLLRVGQIWFSRTKFLPLNRL